MGQVYNGDRDRGMWCAIGAVLVLPWLWSVWDAVVVAIDIADGHRRAPYRSLRSNAVLGHLTLNVAVIIGVVLGLAIWTRISEPRTDSAMERGAQPAGVTADRQGRVDELVDLGRRAYNSGRYAECEALMRSALAVEGDHPTARALLLKAQAMRQANADAAEVTPR